MIRISVIICTYNRANMLEETLGSLIQQTLDKALYEIIVVDNASTDNTSQVIQQIQARHPECNIVLLYESLPGASYTRNAGLAHAQGAYIAFMDDDAKANANWLETALICFDDVQPAPLGIGGLILPFYTSPKPKWFKDEYEIRSWGEQPRFLKQGESFSGSNMIFRKGIFDRYGGFDVSIGPKGEYLSLGEETSLFDKIWQGKSEAKVLYYSPQLVVFHAVPDYKMTISYALKRAFAAGQAWHILHGHKSVHRRLILLPGILLFIAKDTIFALIRWKKYPAYQNWLLGQFAPVATDIGCLVECLGIPIRVKQR